MYQVKMYLGPISTSGASAMSGSEVKSGDVVYEV
jgi:hypothetical protein